MSLRSQAYRLAPEPSRPPRVKRLNFASISSPIHHRPRQISGFVAERRLTRRLCLTALHLRSRRLHTYGFHQTLLRRRDLPTCNHGPAYLLSFQGSRPSPGSAVERLRPVSSGQRPCPLGVGFPLPGSQGRICHNMTHLQFKRHAWRTPGFGFARRPLPRRPNNQGQTALSTVQRFKCQGNNYLDLQGRKPRLP